jgi:hypothetical protein
MASSRLNHGSMVGPRQATSQGAYDSRQQCEAARGDLVGKWRKLGTQVRWMGPLRSALAGRIHPMRFEHRSAT